MERAKVWPPLYHQSLPDITLSWAAVTPYSRSQRPLFPCQLLPSPMTYCAFKLSLELLACHRCSHGGVWPHSLTVVSSCLKTLGRGAGPGTSSWLNTLRSVRVGDEVLLKGRYIELGIHSVGSFGTVYVNVASAHCRHVECHGGVCLSRRWPESFASPACQCGATRGIQRSQRFVV